MWLLLLVVWLAGCQQLPGAVDPKTDSSNISWKGLTTQRDNLPTSKDPDENIEADTVDIREAVYAIIPETELALTTEALSSSFFHFVVPNRYRVPKSNEGI